MNKAAAVDRDAQLHTRREPRRPVASDTELGTWRECVATLLGPKMIGETRDQKRLNALRLAASALDAAGETRLACDVRERIEDAS
jgi:hypothetical protein